MIIKSRLSSSGCNTGAIGMKQSGRSRYSGRFLPYDMHTIDAVDSVSHFRQADVRLLIPWRDRGQ